MELRIIACLLASACLSLALPSDFYFATPVTPEVVYNFDKGTQPENNILRRNEQLLVTDFTGPQIFQLDPKQGPSQKARIVHTFKGYGAVTGIVEVLPEIYVVAVGNSSANTDNTGTWGIWLVNLAFYQPPAFVPGSVGVQQLLKVPTASLLDGLTVVGPGVLAAGEPYQGTIFKIDLKTLRATTLVSSPLLQGKKTGSVFDMVGVNGLKYRDGKLYFTNTGQMFYGYINLDSTGQSKDGGRIHRVYDYPYHLDDFNFAKSGNAYLTTGDTAGGGVLRRQAGTPDGRNGTALVITNSQPNSVTVVEEGKSCKVILTSSITSQILRASLPGAC